MNAELWLRLSSSSCDTVTINTLDPFLLLLLLLLLSLSLLLMVAVVLVSFALWKRNSATETFSFFLFLFLFLFLFFSSHAAFNLKSEMWTLLKKSRAAFWREYLFDCCNWSSPSTQFKFLLKSRGGRPALCIQSNQYFSHNQLKWIKQYLFGVVLRRTKERKENISGK